MVAWVLLETYSAATAATFGAAAEVPRMAYIESKSEHFETFFLTPAYPQLTNKVPSEPVRFKV